MVEEENPFIQEAPNVHADAVTKIAPVVSPKKTKKAKKQSPITVENFPIYVKGSCGILKTIAEKYKCSRVDIKRFLEKNPTMMDYVKEESQNMIDSAENKLHYLMENGDEKVQLNSAQFILKNLAKDRGYTEKSIVAHEGLGEVSINVIMPKAPKKEEKKKDDTD
jgi:hypothetical protein